MSQSEVRLMWFNNGNDNGSCLWLIIILVLLFCCCGGTSSCGCRHDHNESGCC